MKNRRLDATFDHVSDYGITPEIGDERIGELGVYLADDPGDDSRAADELALKALDELAGVAA